MPTIEPPPPAEDPVEYILVADQTSEVIFSTGNQPPSTDSPLAQICKQAGLIRRAGGAVTIFKATKY